MTAALKVGEWSAARTGRTLPPGKTRYPFYRRLGGTQGRSGRAEKLVPTGIRPVWTGGKARPHRDSIPDRPARSSVAIPTELPGPQYIYNLNKEEHPFTNKTSQCSVRPTKPDKLSSDACVATTCWPQCMYSNPLAGEKASAIALSSTV